MVEIFIFPSLVTQIFFYDDLKKLGWKVILKKEARSKKEVANIENVYITTTMKVDGLTTPTRLPTTPNMTFLIGAIKLSEKR
jgi:hypothetical protein